MRIRVVAGIVAVSLAVAIFALTYVLISSRRLKVLRLNRPAVLKGEARYYFGLPVPAGTVAWKVQRVAVRPWWWGWWGPG